MCSEKNKPKIAENITIYLELRDGVLKKKFGTLFDPGIDNVIFSLAKTWKMKILPFFLLWKN